MAVFDESKVINPLHKDKAELGKKYYFADYFGMLKERVVGDDSSLVNKLTRIDGNDNCCFYIAGTMYALLYPYEESPKQRMTNRQLAEWLAKGNGMHSKKNSPTINVGCICGKASLNEEVDEELVICPWGSDEWVEPTVDIYERDCKGDK